MNPVISSFSRVAKRWIGALVPLVAMAFILGSAFPASAADAYDPSDKSATTKKAEKAAEQPMMPTFVSIIYDAKVGGQKLKEEGFGKFLKIFHKQILTLVIVGIAVAMIIRTAKYRAVMPGKIQVTMEMIVTFLYDLIVGILGPKGAQHVPFLGSLFLFIFLFNICGIIPLLGAPTATIQVTATLAIISYGYVLYHNFKWNGVKGYLFHALGSPNTGIMWMFSPLFFAIHMIEEVARPLSLALRLFGNILGKDILIGVFMLLGIGLMGAILSGIGIITDASWTPIGIPLQLPFYFLALLLSAVQALVFTVLTTVYLLLAMPHDDHEHGHDHDHEHGAEAGTEVANAH
jgi:F-type H+-transporting ATPase subunit a